MMTENDPKAIVTTKELVRSVFKFCGDQIGENIKYFQEQMDKNNKEERELTNAKIVKVIHALNDNTEAIREHNRILKDLDLKIETFSLYHEQLGYNLKSGLQGTIHDIERDVKSVWSEIQSCKFSPSTFVQSQHVSTHMQNHHTRTTTQQPLVCDVCGLIFFSTASLESHIITYHAQQLPGPVQPLSLPSDTLAGNQMREYYPLVPSSILGYRPNLENLVRIGYFEVILDLI